MNPHDVTYHDLLRTILETGEERTDRTGTGTLSIFGYQMRFDLAQGFPAVTTKRLFWRGVVEELLWFLKGSTNINELPESARHWWAPWADTNGDLGPIYGSQMRASRWHFEVEATNYEAPQVQPDSAKWYGVGSCGRGRGKVHVMLKNTWIDMLKRCYDPRSIGYSSYGAKGIHVCEEWLTFEKFAEDAQSLPGWRLKLEFPKRYSLDKDSIAASNRYCPNSCKWSSRQEQSMNTSTNMPFYAKAPDGHVEFFSSIGEASRTYGLNLSAVHRCLNGKLHKHKGWSQFKYASTNGKIIRFSCVDQIETVISEIKHNPTSRRIVMNLWHTPAMEHTRLPCCHGSIIQFYVRSSGFLDCHMYQRSGDAFIGVPVNIASYALLTHMIAQVCGLRVGYFIHTLGDAHIYKNHLEQVREQLSREPFAPPQLQLDGPDGIDGWDAGQIKLVGYEHHATIKAEVSK